MKPFRGATVYPFRWIGNDSYLSLGPCLSPSLSLRLGHGPGLRSFAWILESRL